MPRGIPNSKLLADDGEIGDGLQDDILAQENILDEPAPAVDISGKPDQELTPEQRRIRELENELALARGKNDIQPEYEPIPVGEDGTIVIHIVGEGFTALGQNWYVGQELEFDLNGRAYKDTFDRRGRSWLSLADNEMAQAERFGKVMFRSGPWPGKSYDAAAGLPLAHPLRTLSDDGIVYPPTQDELHAVARQESSRGRRAPHLPLR